MKPQTFGQDENTVKIRAWLAGRPDRHNLLLDWLNPTHDGRIDITNVLDSAQYPLTRQSIVKEFKIQ